MQLFVFTSVRSKYFNVKCFKVFSTVPEKIQCLFSIYILEFCLNGTYLASSHTSFEFSWD